MTKVLTGDEEDFRLGNGCMDQIFILTQQSEKERENKKEWCGVFMDLEKVDDKVNREAVYQVRRGFNVSGKLLNIIM